MNKITPQFLGINKLAFIVCIDADVLVLELAGAYELLEWAMTVMKH